VSTVYCYSQVGHLYLVNYCWNDSGSAAAQIATGLQRLLFCNPHSNAIGLVARYSIWQRPCLWAVRSR